jgi:hypothetical protein
MKTKKESVDSVPAPVEIKVNERYEFLLALYKTLQEEGITRISDLETKIAQCEK